MLACAQWIIAEGMMRRLELTTTDAADAAALFTAAKKELSAEGLKIEKAEQSEKAGMTGVEIVISIVISLASAVVANVLQDKELTARIDKAVTKLRGVYKKSFGYTQKSEDGT
jgi:hypothetical protein